MARDVGQLLTPTSYALFANFVCTLVLLIHLVVTLVPLKIQNSQIIPKYQNWL